MCQPNDAPPYLQSVGADIDPSVLATSHAVATGHVSLLGQRDETSTTPIADCAHLADLRGEPTFGEHAANAKTVRFAYVEVAKLVACQPKVDWEHVERLASQVPKVGDDEALLRFCLPLQRDGMAPEVQANFNPVTNTFGCIVDNPDVRICGPAQGGSPVRGTGSSASLDADEDVVSARLAASTTAASDSALVISYALATTRSTAS